MMKRITKSLLAAALSIMLLSMLPICALASDSETPQQVQATLSYNADYFVEKSNTSFKIAEATTKLTENPYNGGHMPASKTLSITGSYDNAEETDKQVYNFSFNDAVCTRGTNDVLEVDGSSQTVNLTGVDEKGRTKYIGIIANTSGDASVTADFTIEFDDETTKTTNVTINSMFTQGTYSHDYGTSLVRTEQSGGERWRYNTDSANTYLNLIELETESIKKIKSITFGAAASPYHVIAVVEVGYTADEITAKEQEALVDLLPKFVGGSVGGIDYQKQSIHEIDDIEAGELSTILGAIDSSHEHYDYIYNLSEGYKLYAPQQERLETYNTLVSDGYLDYTLEDIYADKANKDTHLNNLQALLDLYDAQEEKRTELETLMNWSEFNMTDDEKDVFIELDSDKYNTIKEIIADYEDFEKQKDLEDSITLLFDDYDGKSVFDLGEGDAAKLEALIGYYDEIDEICAALTEAGKEDKIIVSYDEEDRKFIENLKDSYTKYQTSQNNYHYDLTNFFNRGITANPGDPVSSSWGTGHTFDIGGVKYRPGIRKEKWDATAGETGIVNATNYININDLNYNVDHIPSLPNYDSSVALTENYPTFKISTDTDADDKNVVSLTDNTITIQGSGRIAKTLDLLSIGSHDSTNPRFDITITYTDGEVQNQDIVVLWYGYNKNSISPGLPTANISSKLYELVNKNGVATQEVDGPRFAFRAYSIPLKEGKIVDNIVMKRKAGYDAILVALSEQVVDNDKFQSKFIELYNEVKEYDEDTYDVKGATTFYYYCKEAQNRGIDFTLIEDEDGNKVDDITVIEEILGEVLVADAKFAKTAKEEVTATIEFSQPVDLEQLKANLKVEKKNAKDKYENTTVNEITMSDDNKTATVKIADPLLGGVDYKVTVGENLTVKDTTNKISKAYEFSHTSSAWIDFDVITTFKKTEINTVKATLKFSLDIDTSKLAESISITKAGTALTPDKYTISDITATGAVITLNDESLGKVAHKIIISDTLKLAGEYSGYSIGKTYSFAYTSKPYLQASEIKDGKLTITNTTTEGTYKYKLVATEIATDGSDVFANFDSGIIVAGSGSSATHNLGITGTGNLFVSLWDENQKLITTISGDIKATTSKTPEAADYKKPTLDTENVLKIAGFTPVDKVKDKNITLEIFRTAPDVNGGNPKSFMKTQAITNKDGYFEIVIPLNDKIMTDSEYTSGSLLTFSLGGDDFDAPITSDITPVYYATAKQVKETLQSIIDAADYNAVHNIIKSGTDVYDKNIFLLPEDVYKATDYDMEEAAKLIFAKKASLAADSNKNIQSSLETIRQILVLSAFNQGLKDVVAKDGYLIHEDIIGYSEKVDKNSATIYKLYNNPQEKNKELLTATGRGLLIDYLTSQVYESVDALIEKIAETLFYLELEYPNDDGASYVSDVLTSANNTRVSLVIPNYFAFSDKSGINNAIANATITDKTTLTTAINNYYNANYSDGGNDGGGGFSSGSSSVTSFGTDQPYLDSLANQTNTQNSGGVFKDVAKNHWASNYILELYDKNILSGKGNGTFAPEDGLTRAELVKIIVSAKGLKPNGASIPFADVSADSWYSSYVQAAYSNGIISGITDTVFAPDQMISRQDLCVVLYRLLNDKSTGEINFNDSSSIAPYAVDAVKCFVNMGIINGFEDGSFRPNEGCTRAQCAKIISMYLQK